jgi:multiple sugar transport system permease protein
MNALATRPVPAGLLRRLPGKGGWRGKEPGLLLAPAFACLALFVAIPIIAVAILSFCQYDAYTQQLTWAGLANWASMITSGDLRHALVNTIIYTVVTVPTEVIIGLGLALLINAVARGGTFWRVVFFAPAACTLAAMGTVWRWLFYPDTGLIDSTVGHVIGVTNWLNSTTWALPAVAVVGSWFGIGQMMIMFLAGLASVPEPALDAARVDNAGAWNRFWAVTWPALGPATVFATVVATGDALRVFDQVRVMTDGGPLNDTATLSFLQWQEGVSYLNIGAGSVVSVVLFVLVLTTAAVQLLVSRRLSRAGSA